MLAASIAGALSAAALSAAADEAAARGSGATGGAGGGSGPSSGSLKMKSEGATPERTFFYGKRKATYRYSIGGSEPRDLKIQAVNRRNWRVAHTWRRRDIEPGTVHAVHWSGSTKRGRPASPGTYVFRVRSRGGGRADRGRTRGEDRTVDAYPYEFPVRGRHTYGDGYGAPRAGHVHQGQDVLAPCGLKVVAARGGRVQYRANQPGGAGFYMVIDGKGTGHDFVYMHLRRRGRPKRGKRVRTGQRIGLVGHTGDATGCHLHFEMWTRPGWYQGGHPMRSVTRHLKRWDRWS